MGDFVMETKIKWNEGEGYITAAYEGSGSGSASISSDINEGIDRAQSIKVDTTDKSVSATLVVLQEGMREVFEPSDGEFVLVDGGTFNVLKDDEFTFVEFIDTGGVKYIDTGFKPSNKTRIVLKAKALILNDNSHWWYGVRKSSSVDAFGFMSQSSNTRTVIWFGTKSVSHVFKTSLLNSIIEIDQNKNVTSLKYQDGTFETVTNEEKIFSSSYNLFIGQISLAGSPASRSAGFNGLIYGCKIYEEDTLVRDFVPCVNKEGEYGLYDKVNLMFYHLIER